MYDFSGAAWRHIQTKRILVTASDKSKRGLLHGAFRIYSSCGAYSDFTTIWRARFKVQIDRDSLKLSFNGPNATGRLAKGCLRLFKFDFDGVHRADVNLQEADVFFRLTGSRENKAPIGKDLLVTGCKFPACQSRGMRLKSDITSFSDVAGIQAIAEVVEDNVLEKGESAREVLAVLQHQITDTFCEQAAVTVVQANAECTIHKNELVVRAALILEAVQNIVSHPLWTPLLCHSHYPVIVGHFRLQKMYEFMRLEFYWPHKANSVFTATSSCSACGQYQVEARLKEQLQLFFASSSCELIFCKIYPRTTAPNCR